MMIGVLLATFPVIPIDTSFYKTRGLLIWIQMAHSRRYQIVERSDKLVKVLSQ